jgi:hypothetical protein
MCSADCIQPCLNLNEGACVDKCIFQEVDGTAKEILDTDYYVIAHNYIQSTDSPQNPAIGNLVVQKVQAVYKIQHSSIALPTKHEGVTLEIDGGDVGYVQSNLLGPEQYAALKSNYAILPPFPFNVDVAVTLFANYAGQEYRATGNITVTITGLETLVEPTPVIVPTPTTTPTPTPTVTPTPTATPTPG